MKSVSIHGKLKAEKDVTDYERKLVLIPTNVLAWGRAARRGVGFHRVNGCRFAVRMRKRCPHRSKHFRNYKAERDVETWGVKQRRKSRQSIGYIFFQASC